MSGEGFAGWMGQKKGGAYRAYGPDSTAQGARIAAGNRAKPTPYAKGIGGVTKQAASTAVIYASALDVLESAESLESVDLDSLAASLDSRAVALALESVAESLESLVVSDGLDSVAVGVAGVSGIW